MSQVQGAASLGEPLRTYVAYAAGEAAARDKLIKEALADGSWDTGTFDVLAIFGARRDAALREEALRRFSDRSSWRTGIAPMAIALYLEKTGSDVDSILRSMEAVGTGDSTTCEQHVRSWVEELLLMDKLQATFPR